MALHRPERGESILWKQYGFRHIARSSTHTFCGQDFGWRIERYEEWSKRSPHYATKIKYGEDTLHRPLCGNCAKLKG